MNVVWKVPLLCVMFCAALSYADRKLPGPAVMCLTQLLKAMGKLRADFQSVSVPVDPLVCYYVTELSTMMAKSSIHGDIKAKIPNDADCLTEKFDLHRTIYDVLKVRVIDGSNSLNDTEKQRQLEEARSELTNSLEKIVADCPTDNKKFINIFHISLAIKNETLEAHQAEYCLAKYTVDNKLLKLDDEEVWNPHHIDSNSVDCDEVVANEKIDIEREVRNVYAVIPKVGQQMDCIMELFRTSNAIESNVALKVLTLLDLPEETKESEGVNHSTIFTNFMSTAYTTCAKEKKSA